MADLLEELKKIISPDTMNVSGLGAPSLPSPTVDPSIAKIRAYTPPPDPIYRPFNGMTGQEAANQFAREGVGQLRYGVEQLAGAGHGAGEQAVAPTARNFKPWMKEFEGNYRALDPYMNRDTKAGIALAQTKAPRATSQVPVEYPETLGAGSTYGMYKTRGEPKIQIARKVVNKDVLTEPQPVDEAAATLLHEAVGHARQVKDFGVREGSGTAGTGEPFPRQSVNTRWSQFYDDLGTLAKGRAGEEDVSKWPANEHMYDYIQDLIHHSDTPEPQAEALRRIMDAGYHPKDFREYIKKFTPPPGADKTAADIRSMPRSEAEYHGNPMEIWAEQAGRTGKAFVNKFYDQIYPELSGGGDFSEFIRNLERTMADERAKEWSRQQGYSK